MASRMIERMEHWPKSKQLSAIEWIISVVVVSVIGLVVGLCIGALVVLVTSFPQSKAWGRDDGRYANVNPEIREWVRGLKDAKGISCCDTADGYPAEAVWDTDQGRYRVLLDGAWHDVPDGALLRGPNRFGYAVVWYAGPKNARVIRCFIPGLLS